MNTSYYYALKMATTVLGFFLTAVAVGEYKLYWRPRSDVLITLKVRRTFAVISCSTMAMKGRLG